MKNKYQMGHTILAAVLRITIKERLYYSNDTELKESENIVYASKVVLTQSEELLDRLHNIYSNLHSSLEVALSLKDRQTNICKTVNKRFSNQ
jgi:hypothetical protein